MDQTVQGIPNLPDLTHANELVQFGSQIITLGWQLAMFFAVLGVVMVLVAWANRRSSEAIPPVVQLGVNGYFQVLQKLPHTLLILLLLIGGFFWCSTLANRYHHWEQQKVAQLASTVSGDRLEQPAPRIRYVVEEPYVYYNWVDGRQVRVEETRKVDRFMTLSGSQIDVNINQTRDVQNRKEIYTVDFAAEYQVENKLRGVRDFFFEFRPPYGYTLMQNFKIERDGVRLEQVNPGDYGFPFVLAPGQKSAFRVTFQAQGAPRWVYDAGGESISSFRLTVLANFPKADFASGILPTETKEERGGTRFTWLFEDNVSVRNPFGVFTATEPVRNTGIIPRLLLLAPGVFLWWMMLLYLSVPLSLRDVAIAAGIFFASLLFLTYTSRIIDVKLAWGLISPLFLGMMWGLGTSRKLRIAAFMSTLAGGVLPVWGLIVTYSGLTLSLAGLLSAGWLSVLHWFGWNKKVPNP